LKNTLRVVAPQNCWYAGEMFPQESALTITINLSPATLEQLKAEAQATGKDVETVVREAVETKLARRKQTFAEILKPIHDAIEESGTSEDEVESLIDKELKAVRKERHSARMGP
jgi:hypothetical protein